VCVCVCVCLHTTFGAGDSGADGMYLIVSGRFRVLQERPTPLPPSPSASTTASSARALPPAVRRKAVSFGSGSLTARSAPSTSASASASLSPPQTARTSSGRERARERERERGGGAGAGAWGGRVLELCVLGPNEWFGEVATVTHAPARTASVVSVCSVLYRYRLALLCVALLTSPLTPVWCADGRRRTAASDQIRLAQHY
jgi:hypothetical protein